MNVFANQATILEPAQVAELCKKHGFVFETRFREELERHQQAWLDRVSIELNSYQQQRSDKFSKLLGEDGEVPWKICRDVCWNAMEWEIKGRIRPSRRDADHLKKGPYGWEINLGGKSANRFGIALAIKRCREKLAEMFPESQSRWEILTASEKANLEVWVRKSIIRHDDKLYGLSYQGRKDGRIPLGNHLVNPPSVVEALLHFSGFNSWQKPSPLAVAI